MIEDAIKLIDLGETAEDDRTAEVIATITPVSRDETFQASQQKMQARYRMEVWAEEYDGQDEVEWDDKKYSIYRTYGPTDSGRIELYVCDRIGTV